MEGFFNALTAVVVLLMLMSVGYFMGRLGWMGPGEKKFISKFVVNVAVPCNCLVGLLNNLDRSMLAQAGWMAVVCFFGVVLTLGLSFGAARLLRLPRERRGVFIAMAGLSNVLFVGLPVTTQIFGDRAIPHVMIYYLANTVLVQTVGMALIQSAGTGDHGPVRPLALLKDLVKKPPVIAITVSLCLLLLGLRPPAVVMKFAGYISGTVSPLALMFCGYILYEVGLKNLRLLPGLGAMLAIRLAVSPLICWGMCVAFGIGGLAQGVFVVESALPVVSQVVVMTGAFGADEEYAATGSCLSTLCCFLTIPILMLLLG